MDWIVQKTELGLEDKVKELGYSEQISNKPSKTHEWSTREFGNTVKRSNLQIVSLEGKEECHNKGTESIFSKIMKERFPSLQKDMPTQVQEAYRMPSEQGWKGNSYDILQSKHLKPIKKDIKSYKRSFNVRGFIS